MRYLLGLIAAFLEVTATAVLGISVILSALLSKLPFGHSWKKTLQRHAENHVIYWARFNHFILHFLLHVDIQVMGKELLDAKKNYLVIANHQSWADIFVLEDAILEDSGASKYFIKKNLVYLPIVGLAMKALRFPIMSRFTKDHLAKHPEDKGKDIEITKRACEVLRGSHFKLNSYAEGTRFTRAKHIRQKSPYRHLLKPKAGGVAYALSMLHEQLDSILNLTIVYDTKPNIIRFFMGQIKTVKVIIEKIPITPDLIGNYEEDKTFRINFQRFMNNLWQKKDEQMDRLK